MWPYKSALLGSVSGPSSTRAAAGKATFISSAMISGLAATRTYEGSLSIANHHALPSVGLPHARPCPERRPLGQIDLKANRPYSASSGNVFLRAPHPPTVARDSVARKPE